MSHQDRFEAEALPHWRSLYGTAYRLTRNAHDAEDLVQETLLRAFRAFDGFTQGTNIRAWLYTILHRVRIDGLRREGRTPDTVELVGDGPAVAATQERLDADALEQALWDLPEAFRAALLLRDVQEFSYAEIAEILDVPVGTVMSRIHRGRALMRRLLGGRRP